MRKIWTTLPVVAVALSLAAAAPVQTAPPWSGGHNDPANC